MIWPLFLVAITSANCVFNTSSIFSGDIIFGAYSLITSSRAWYSAFRSSRSAGQLSTCSCAVFSSFIIARSTNSSGISSLFPSSIASFFTAEIKDEIVSFRALSLAFIAATISLCNFLNSIIILHFSDNTISSARHNVSSFCFHSPQYTNLAMHIQRNFLFKGYSLFDWKSSHLPIFLGSLLI